MPCNKVPMAGQKVVGSLVLSSAIALLTACGGNSDVSSSSSQNNNNSSASSMSSVGNSSSSVASSTSSTNSSTNSSTSSSTSSGGNSSIPADDTTPGRFRVNAQGQITEQNQVFPVRCGNWFGLEGQHEPKDAESNADGAPLELYIGNMWWVESGRDIDQTMREIKNLGINMIRLPIAPQTLEPNNEQGMTRVWNGSSKNPNGRLKNDAASYPYDTAREALEGFIKIADTHNIKVLVDIHSCSNYVGWRAGRLNANPPYADADRVGYDYKRESYSCGGGAANDQPYNETIWLNNLREIARLPSQLGVDNIIGIDIFNEPWDYTWDEWATLAEKAYQAISATNDDLLVFVEGVGSGTSADIEVPHGDADTNPNWGENFWGFSQRPLNIPRNRVVISPHTYGPSVFAQGQFMTGNCAELEGDAAAEAGCQFNFNTSLLESGWQEHFGYLRDMNYAVVIGEFGGNMDWPHQGTRAAEREMWQHINGNPDEDWQNYFVDYMVKENIQACYWSINPESGDTGGIYRHNYDPVSAEDAWGQWDDFDQRKTNLLKELWGM